MSTLSVKPHLLRADTIDLQPHDNPSAKDHTRGQPNSGYNHAGTHHIQQLRSANQDAYIEQQTSPRMGSYDPNPHGPHSVQDHSQMYDEGEEDEDEHDHQQNGMNGIQHGQDYDGEDPNDSQDEDMDDELLDKISSSPSIEDGKQSWPERADSLYHGHPQVPWSAPTRGISYSPSSPISGPIRSFVGSHQSDQAGPKRRINFSSVPKLSPTRSPNVRQPPSKLGIAESSSIENISRHLLPVDDPFLEFNSDEAFEDSAYDEEEGEWEDEKLFDGIESSDDDLNASPFDAEPRFLDSGWGGECLRDAEDIDFEFVYALHTFVATVEGQANATKGDTMVLLDDSNSYWWLVRVVKDGTIGYLPAEHIETPTERLARLNKHRNIDLSAAMLGDNPEKSKNPLKKAMRRRNAKTVNFAPPTYYEPEERVWSDNEEVDDDDDDMAHAEDIAEGDQQASSQQSQQVQQAQQDQQGQQGQHVRQVNEISEPQRAESASATIHRINDRDESEEDEPGSPVKNDLLAPAPLQTSSQDNVQRSRNGVVRNTDSFFKDDTVETKKISLTPRLLRGDSAINTTEQEPRQGPSLDTFDKIGNEDKTKDGKKKEKKGMLSGLFKRKDKGIKGARSDTDETDRASEDSGRSPQSKESMESDLTPERKPSKLQKAPPTVSPKSSPTDTRAPQRDFGNQQSQLGPQKAQVEPAPVQQPTQHLSPEPQSQQPSRFPSLQEKRSVFAPITSAIRSKNSSQDMGESVKPVYSKRAKERFAIDDSDSENDSTPTAQSSILHRSISPLDNNEVLKLRPDSGTGVSPLEGQFPATARPPLAEVKVPEKSSLNQQTTIETPTSPSDQTASTSKQSPSIPTHTPSTSRSTPTWSDASLRSYMDNDQDIRDLLIIVHDKTNVTPVGPEHPLMNGLFASERTKLADMQSQLDSMLVDWLSKKNQPVVAKV